MPVSVEVKLAIIALQRTGPLTLTQQEMEFLHGEGDDGLAVECVYVPATDTNLYRVTDMRRAHLKKNFQTLFVHARKMGMSDEEIATMFEVGSGLPRR